MRSLPSALRDRAERSGFSLLEVLVASAILVVALSGIAAILPAATFRLTQAAAEDRAATLARNALADFLNRGLATADAFVGPQLFSPPVAAFGPITEDLNNNALLDAGEDLNGNGTLDPPNEDVNNDRTLNGGEDSNVNNLLDRPPYSAAVTSFARIDRGRSLQLEDELRYGSLPGRDTPTNVFTKNSVVGVRDYNDGLCWAALLAAQTTNPQAGDPALLSLAIFRKVPTSTVMNLFTPNSAGETARQFTLFRGDSTATALAATAIERAANEATRRRFLRQGSYILLLPTANLPPVWVQVASSWTTIAIDPSARKSFVMLAASPPAGCLFPGTGGARFVRAICYEGLMRVEHQQVTLE